MYNYGFLLSAEWHFVTVTVVADMHKYYAYSTRHVHHNTSSLNLTPMGGRGPQSHTVLLPGNQLPPPLPPFRNRSTIVGDSIEEAIWRSNNKWQYRGPRTNRELFLIRNVEVNFSPDFITF